MSNVRTDSRDYDVISVGSGHHGLIAAAYLAKAGKRVLVLERQDYIGGGCVTKELAPGFRYDEHSTVHQVILLESSSVTGADIVVDRGMKVW